MSKFKPEVPPFRVQISFKDASFNVSAVKDDGSYRAEAKSTSGATLLSVKETFTLAALQRLLEMMASEETDQSDFVKKIEQFCGKAQDQDRMVRCEWMRSGRLTLRVGNEKNSYKHANTIDAALERRRTFTTTMSVYNALKNVNRKLD